MATLIQSKQIQGVVTASVIDGDFSVSGSLFVSGSGIITNALTASSISASSFKGNGSLLTFGGTGIVSSSIQVEVQQTTGYTAFSSSIASTNDTQNIRLSRLETATSSYETKGRGIVSSSIQVLGGTDIISSSAQISALGYVVGGGGGGTSDYTQLINVPNGIISGSSQITALGFVSSSTNISSLNAFTSSINQKFDTLATQSGSWGMVSGSVPNGTISSSAQISALGYVTASTSVPSGTISGSSQLTASFDSRYTLSGSVQNVTLPSNVVSGSSQISYTGLSNIPAGIISSSQQLPQGLVSGSSQVLGGSGVLSGSIQLPSGVVSGSSQILGGSGVISGSSQLTSSYDTRYTLSGSVQNVILPTDLISSSAQITALGFVSGSYATSQSVAELVISSSQMTASIAELRADVDSLASSGVPAGTISGSLQIQRAGFLLSSSFNSFTQSLATAITASGTNVTINGNLTVKGTTTTINSTTLQIGDNVIELNGSNLGNAGLLVKDSLGASPNTSGSLLWDSANDRWIAGPKNSEENILLAGSDGVVSGSSQISFTELSNLPTGIVSSSDQITSSLDTKYVLSGSITQTTWDNIANKPSDIVSGSSQLTSSFDTRYSLSGSGGDILFTQTGSAYRTQNNLEITGSLNVSGTINSDNVAVGIPSSNAWQSNLSGSYFNNFTSETNVSEILRFVAGLLSSSAPDAAPNTKTFSTVTDAATNTTTGTALAGRIPQTSTNTTITYLNSKGFASAGSTVFAGIGTIYTQDTYQVSYTSVAAGSTIVSSSADAQLFGLGLMSNGTPTNFKVSGSFTHRFKDNSTRTDTATSSSQLVLTQTGAGTTAGVTLAKINTANIAVIPPAYQDGKFASILPQKIYVTGSTSTINVTGYYDVTASISIASGSSGYTTPVVVTEGIFYAPLTQIATNVPAQTVTTSSVALSYVSAVSRSLSGAPYLSGSTYTVSSSLNNVFSPLFLNGTNAQLTLSGTGMGTTSGNNALVTSNGTISNANVVYDSTGTTIRNTATIPFETDIVKLNGLYSFTGANITNIGQTSFTPTTFSVSAVGYDYAGAADTYTNTLSYHVAGTFGQPASSGSLAYFTRTQGADTSTALVESFTGENYRIQLADNVLAFNGTAWTTTFGLYTLGATDLQVKPGYLVKPGGTYGYWLGNPSTASDYKYYIRKFTTSGTKASMTLDLGKTLVAWDSATDGVSATILFESSKSSSPYVTSGKARVYDPTKTLANFVSTISANTDGQNPFGSSIDLYGNNGGSVSSTTYTIPIRNADGMYLNATYTNIYVLVRYKGDPSPVTTITTTFS